MKTFPHTKETKPRGAQYGVFMVITTVLALAGATWLIFTSDKNSATYKTGYDVLLCGLPFLAISLVMILLTNANLVTTVDEQGIETRITRPFRKVNRIAWKEISQARIATSGNLTSLLLTSTSGKKMGFHSTTEYFNELVEEVHGQLEKNGIPLIKG
jgi:hypothetical protein